MEAKGRSGAGEATHKKKVNPVWITKSDKEVAQQGKQHELPMKPIHVEAEVEQGTSHRSPDVDFGESAGGHIRQARSVTHPWADLRDPTDFNVGQRRRPHSNRKENGLVCMAIRATCQGDEGEKGGKQRYNSNLEELIFVLEITSVKRRQDTKARISPFI